jgi:lysophospholipase L1-like esterase
MEVKIGTDWRSAGWRAALTVAVLLAAASCSSSSTPTTTTATTATTVPKVPTSTVTTQRSSSQPSIPAGSTYVAIGSSDASGFGIAVQSGGACGRSDHNYPHLVAAKLRLHLTDVTCGGATTANVVAQPQGSAPPQIEAVTADTRLITMTVGGNDVNYIGTTLMCGNPASDCLATIDKTSTDAAFAALPQRLEDVIAKMRSRAPHSEILLVTYPQVVAADCAALSLDADEATYIHDLGQRLEDVFLQVAKNTRVVLVDAYPASKGHDPCSPSHERWVAGLKFTNGYSYHPTALGHRAMASLVLGTLGHH